MPVRHAILFCAASSFLLAAPVRAQGPAALRLVSTGADAPKPSRSPRITGLATLITLPATPLLDEDGKQRLDPDGAPMFNPEQVQQRDKHGHPLFNTQGQPIFQTATDRGFDEHGKKLPVEKVKPPKPTSLNVAHGALTIDGFPAPAEINCDIAELKFLYLYVPGIGTSVVSTAPFPGAKAYPEAFKGNVLEFHATDHDIRLKGDKNLLSRRSETAWIMLDRTFRLPVRNPVVGYGDVTTKPYDFPDRKPQTQVASATR